MRPEVSELLRTTAMQVPGIAAPTAYALGSAGLIAGLLMIASQEYDRAAETRMNDNADMRALFAELAPAIADATLRAKLETAAKTTDPSIRISVLNAANADLRKLLIVLQTYVEEVGDTAAQKRVWGVLNTSANRRMLATAMA
ncbi:MAG TPA: hypothetical protein VGG10_21925 [Rhizomicrobium sp.]|jgi:hypothetical protein